MFTVSTLTTYVGIVLVLFLIPGPAVLFIATRTAQSGRKAGVMAGLGISTGDVVHTSFASVGLSAILMTSAVAFSVVKYAGAAYLLYLGIRAIWEKPSDPRLPLSSYVTPLKSYRQGIVVEVLNPKTALFFLAFLPQFVHTGHGSTILQFLTLGLIFVTLSAIYTTLTAVSVGLVGRLIRRVSWMGRWSGKIVGVIYIGLGLKVAIQSR